jgi:pyridoxal biosynthesis lyase PdxS
VRADRLTTRDLSLAYVASTVAAAVMTAASVGGLVSGSGIYAGTDPKLLPLFVGPPLG